MAVTIGEAFDALGYALKDSETVAIVTINDRTRTQPFGAVVDHPIGPNTYFSTGTFADSTTFQEKGDRSGGKVRRILELPFDFDLKDFLNVDKEDLYDLTDEELTSYIRPLQDAVEDIFRRLGLPIHRLDYTGYGLSAHLNVPPHKSEDVATIRSLHAGIVKKLNTLFGSSFADPQVSDAGPRIMRLVPCLNIGTYDDGRKAPARESRNLYTRDGYIDERQLRAASDTVVWDAQKIDVEANGKGLTAADLQAIVDAYKPFHQQGQKHLMGLAIAGQLGKARVPEDQALEVVRAISADDNKPWDREKAVHDTYDKLRSGVPVSGFYRLKGIVRDDVIEYVDRILEKLVRATTASIIQFSDHTQDRKKSASVVDELVHSIDPEPIPDICYRGWIARYVDMMEPLSEAPASFHFGAGLGLIGATFGRKVHTKYVSRKLYGNQYVMLIGVAGDSKKDTAIDFALDMPNMRDREYFDRQQRQGMTLQTPPFHMTTDIGSAQGLIEMLQKHRNMVAYITEYERLSQTAKNKSTSTIFPTLTAAWSAPNVLQTGTKEATALRAELPTLSIMAAVQPDVLSNEMTANEINNGFASRWIFVPGKPDSVLPYPPSIDESAAFYLYKEITDIAARYGDERNDWSTELPLTPASLEMWSDWYHRDHARKRSMNEFESAVASRLAVHIQKVALIYAGMDEAAEIGVEHLEPAIAFVEWTWKHTRELLRTWGTSSWGQLEERIITVLKRRPGITRRDLQSQCRNRKWGSREFAQVLEAMVRNGTIDVDVEGRHALAA